MLNVFRGLAAVSLGLFTAACARERAPDVVPDTPVAVTLMNNPIAWALEPPGTWDDRVTMEDESVAPGALHHSARAFLFSPRDTSVRPQALLAVLVYDSANWARISAEAGPPPGDTIMTREGRVYVASLPQSNPFAPGSSDAHAFDSLSVTLEYVRRAFRTLR